MLKTIMKTIVSASFCLAAIAPASAAPMIVQKPAIEITSASGLVEVQYRERRYDRNSRRDFRDRRDDRRGFYRHNNRGYYNGHRGYREQRRGYRQYNGYWFPPAAFALGAIIGGALNNNNVIVRPGSTNPQHVRWCNAKYRSYDVRSNTFQPYNGPRRECRSPYY
ncbi:MAG: BA14K family protein [Hoeflea sp.]|uniref:BA14K family protein n=1 Tax=Hoeflea sp. TaxID=1940281 RepID=UPI001D4E7F33|nr:BA14K family protein [Hoeflea sp.]MBU4529139.1 BA14K family protein [Alphaproteobacteria bacterium]MBU4543544.1 BA14K family protein [Alphaproteobacteria bacterium]MBU4549169.1 BA14K family protein [Alphaproteobacteria bacterium]MBV1725304.1 BA14K family protein [Hoeflea sp.]MBV1785265.1 BA14K family protein [Hoeflea sp.]